MNLKKYYPFIVPTIALLLVIFLAFRWYNLRTQREDMTMENDIEIETLTPEEELGIIQGTEDVSTVPLDSEVDEPVLGQVRYRIEDERILLSVSADLPEEEQYQVWIRAEDEEMPRRAFELSFNKAGFTGSGSLSTELLPFEVIITQEPSDLETVMDQALLKGMVQPDME